MKEASKAMLRRNTSYEEYFTGWGIDIGCGDDCIDKWMGKFPITGVTKWDLENGDAQVIKRNEKFSFVHSSHCLEHMSIWSIALANWMNLLIDGGYCIVTVPSWEMYEREIWPSVRNSDHKWAFSLYENKKSWVVNLNKQLLSIFGEVIVLKEITDGYDPSISWDQTLGSAECAIEFVLRKR
jgi:hypothetical protein